MISLDSTHVKHELDGSIVEICSHGLKNGIRFFANPFGDIPQFNSANDLLIRSKFICSRGIGDQGYISPIPYSIAKHPRHPTRSFSIRAATTLSDIYAAVKRAKKYKSYVVWNLHNVATGLDITEANFDTVLSYIKNTAALPARTLSDIFNIETPQKMIFGERRVTDNYQNCLAASATRICSSADLSAVTPITFTLSTQPDIPRALSFVLTHTNITAFSITVTGIDSKGDSVTESFTETNGWSFTSKFAYSLITSIQLTSRTGTGIGDAINIGTTDKLGLSNYIYAANYIYKLTKNTSNITISTSKIDRVYCTYDLSESPLADGDNVTIWYKHKSNMLC
jgi:hypothetical protein